jgi:hypothetical protein
MLFASITLTNIVLIEYIGNILSGRKCRVGGRPDSSGKSLFGIIRYQQFVSRLRAI